MPTNLPPRAIETPKSSTAGTLACLAAVLMMLVLSYTTLQLHPDGVASDTPQFQGL